MPLWSSLGVDRGRSSMSGGEGSSPRHFAALDGLRGVASLIVVLSHSAAFLYLDLGRPSGPLGGILKLSGHAGQLAVVLFFVLSGFVLYLAFARRPETPYAA